MERCEDCQSFHTLSVPNTVSSVSISVIAQKTNTWSSKLFEVIGIVTLACVTFASLGISVWNLVDQQSRVELEAEYISNFEGIQINLSEFSIRLINFQNSVNDSIATLERTIQTNILHSVSELYKLEREIQMSTNNRISELERRIMRFQISYMSEIERRTLTNRNDRITKLERKIVQLQNSVDELLVETDVLEFERRIQRHMNDSISELERKVQIQNENIMELNRTLSIRNDRIELQRNNILLVQSSIEFFQKYMNFRFRNFPLPDCSHVYQLIQTSGYYWILPQGGNGSFLRVYCDLNRQCGCSGSPAWAHVALLDMSDSNQVCPRNWTTTSTPMRTCGRGKTARGGCSSVFFPTYGLRYNRVCGRIRAYQYGDTTAFFSLRRGLDNDYLSGVSLTHGSVGSRQHIWSFASARGEGSFFQETICSCSSRGNWTFTTGFVGNNYFCDSGNEGHFISNSRFYSNDPLWDGRGCSQQSTCCQFNLPPWFCTFLPQPTGDDLEVRICKSTMEQDIAIELIDLYTQL